MTPEVHMTGKAFITHIGTQSAVEDAAAMSLEVDLAIARSRVRAQKILERVIWEQRQAKGLGNICEDCLGPIEAKRTVAKPFAVRCCLCQKEAEREEEAGKRKDRYPVRSL